MLPSRSNNDDYNDVNRKKGCEGQKAINEKKEEDNEDDKKQEEEEDEDQKEEKEKVEEEGLQIEVQRLPTQLADQLNAHDEPEREAVAVSKRKYEGMMRESHDQYAEARPAEERMKK